MLVQLETSSYKVKFVSRRHRTPLRVIVPMGEATVATFGETVVDAAGKVIKGPACATWILEDYAESLSRYLETRKHMRQY